MRGKNINMSMIKKPTYSKETRHLWITDAIWRKPTEQTKVTDRTKQNHTIVVLSSTQCFGAREQTNKEYGTRALQTKSERTNGTEPDYSTTSNGQNKNWAAWADTAHTANVKTSHKKTFKGKFEKTTSTMYENIETKVEPHNAMRQRKSNSKD